MLLLCDVDQVADSQFFALSSMKYLHLMRAYLPSSKGGCNSDKFINKRLSPLTCKKNVLIYLIQIKRRFYLFSGIRVEMYTQWRLEMVIVALVVVAAY